MGFILDELLCSSVYSGNPQEVPSSPFLSQHSRSPSTSLAGFRDSGEISREEDLSLHDSTCPLEGPRCGPAKRPVSTIKEGSERAPSRDGFSHQSASITSELDPSLQLLLGGSVSPAVGSSTPSPTANGSTGCSPPVVHLREPGHLRGCPEEMTGFNEGLVESLPRVSVTAISDNHQTEELSELV